MQGDCRNTSDGGWMKIRHPQLAQQRLALRAHRGAARLGPLDSVSAETRQGEAVSAATATGGSDADWKLVTWSPCRGDI